MSATTNKPPATDSEKVEPRAGGVTAAACGFVHNRRHHLVLTRAQERYSFPLSTLVDIRGTRETLELNFYSLW